MHQCVPIKGDVGGVHMTIIFMPFIETSALYNTTKVKTITLFIYTIIYTSKY